MFQNNDYRMIARSKPIRVGNSVELRAELAGGQVQVTLLYSDPKARSSWDWVALYAAGETDNGAHGGRYAYVAKDVLALPAPKRPGGYVVRYFQSGSGLSELAESRPIQIADSDSVSVSVSGGEATVSWHIESVANSSKDRIALFKEGVFNPLVPLAVQLTHSNKADGVAKVSRRCWLLVCVRSLETAQFSLPSVAGRYEFVFIANGSAHPVKKSPPFEI